MSFPKRDFASLGLFGALVFSFTDCSLLSKVDWTAIPPETNVGGMNGEAGDAASAGADSEAGQGGVAGEGGEGGEGGASGEAGSSEQTGGSGGFGGTVAGSGGTAGKGGTGGGAGDQAIAGSGGALLGHPTCSTAPTEGLVTPSSIGAKAALVLFDGGPGTNGNRMGRAGLDAACEAAKTKLQLQQSKTHAVISVAANDQIYDMAKNYQIPRKSPAVVSSVGKPFAASWEDLWQFPERSPSLVCAGVMPPTALRWLTGTNNKKVALEDDPTVKMYGLWDTVLDMSGQIFDNSCKGWQLADFDAGNQAHAGSTIADHDPGTDLHPRLLDYVVVSCAKATYNVLCIAYEPVP